VGIERRAGTLVKRFRRAAAFAALITTLGGIATSGGGPSITATAPAGAAVKADQSARPWMPLWMSEKRSFTAKEAKRFANNFDLIVAHPWQLAPHSAAMKAANPRLQLFAYVNGTFTRDELDPSLYAYDASGNRITWEPWGTYLGNVRQPGWRSYVIGLCTQKRAEANFDGCFFDNVGWTVVSVGPGRSAAPIDPLTGLLWDASTWLLDVDDFITAVRAALPGVPTAANGYGRGISYFDAIAPTSLLNRANDLVMAEQFVRAAGDGVDSYRSEDKWKQDVDMLVHAEAEGVGVLTVTKVWVTATSAQKKQWQRYAIATFMLGAGDQSRFAFTKVKSGNDVVTAPASVKRIVGAPLAPYRKSGAIYRREFAKGIAFVNPTAKRATVSLTGTYRNMANQLVDTRLVLEPHTGDVLKRV
jgi:hypothetical protein